MKSTSDKKKFIFIFLFYENLYTIFLASSRSGVELFQHFGGLYCQSNKLELMDSFWGSFFEIKKRRN